MIYVQKRKNNEMDWPQIGECIADRAMEKAVRIDELPKHLYSTWRTAFLEAFCKQTQNMPTDKSVRSGNSNSPMQTLNRATHARDSIEKRAMRQYDELSKHFRFSTTDKAAGSFAIICTTQGMFILLSCYR